MSVAPNPYAAPVAAVEVADPTSWRPALRRAGVCLGASLGVGALTIPATMFIDSSASGAIGFSVMALCAAAGAWFAGATVLRAVRARPPRTGLITVGGLCLFVVHAAMMLFGAGLALLSSSGGRGRQLRRFGRVLLPRLRSGAGREWSRGAARVDVADEIRGPLAAQWRENARTEHASVGAFAVLTMDLLVLGAPPELLGAAQRDGLDETRHAQMCLALATAIDGIECGPAPFPESRRARSLPRTRILALAQLAVDSLVDGVVHEGVSARIIARLARTAEIASIRETLVQLAADEGRHAAHAWHVVEWCVQEGGEPVLCALRGAVRTLPAAMHSDLRSEAEDGGWQRWGIPGRALESAEYGAARAHAVGRVAALAEARA